MRRATLLRAESASVDAFRGAAVGAILGYATTRFDSAHAENVQHAELGLVSLQSFGTVCSGA